MRLTRSVFLRFPLHGGAIAASAALLAVAGCGGVGGPAGEPVAGGSTMVAIQLSSRANDLLVQYTTTIQSITLTSKSGATVTIFNTPTNVDFIPANGEAYPLATVTVPQNVYTSAAITMAVPNFSYTFLDSSGSDNFVHYSYLGATPMPVVTLMQPVTVSGAAMGMILSLDVSKSLAISKYKTPSASTFTGNPTLALTTFPISAEATTPLNGKCNGLNGQITAVNASGGTMTVALAGDGVLAGELGLSGSGYVPGRSINASLSNATQYQGVSSASALAVGTFVNLDLALLPDGSYAATRIEVNDPTTTNVTTALVEFASAQYADLSTMPYQYQGSELGSSTGSGYEANAFVYTGTTKFQTAAELTGFPALPFAPTFSGTSLIPGQITSIGAVAYATLSPNYTQPSSITLRPQTIDAVVTGVSTTGSYTVYTVHLAAYDPIVSLNGPPINPNQVPIPQPATVAVYTNASTPLLNTTTPIVGGTYRIRGLLLEDSGVLRMAADQVSDGVTQ
jgi:hypothetical protein